MQEDIEQYDYDGGYDYLTDSCQIEDIPSLVRTPSTNQEILELKDVMKFIDQLIGNMGELLNLDADNTYEILMFYNWNKDRIECEYHETILEQLKNKEYLIIIKQFVTQTKSQCVPFAWKKLNQFSQGVDINFAKAAFNNQLHKDLQKNNFQLSLVYSMVVNINYQCQ